MRKGKVMDDLISRQAAIEAVEHITSSMSICVNTDECHGMKRMQRLAVIELTNLPSAQPEPQWILCSERLPDKKGKYLCTVHYAISPYHMFHPELDTYVDEISIQEFEEAKDGNVAFIDSVVSWMPLPEPYEGES